MLVRITAKRQVTLPSYVLDALGVKPGDRLELAETPDGFVLRTRVIHVSRLAPLRGKLRRGRGTFDMAVLRRKPHGPALRD
jgi:AbrB family looped-hinge helix DNA binding protein